MMWKIGTKLVFEGAKHHYMRIGQLLLAFRHLQKHHSGLRRIRLLRFLKIIIYSFFNSIAGFVFAALSTCQITDTNAMAPERSTATTKIHP